MSLTPTQIQNGISQDLFNVSNQLGVGVYQSPITVFNCIPQSITTPSLQIVAVNDVESDVPFPFVTANVQNIEGIPVPVVPLDCQRGVQMETTYIFGFSESGNITITGYDENHNQVINTISFTVGGISVSSTKTFKYISSIVSDVALDTILCFPSYLIGLPYYLARIGYVFSCTVNQAAYAYSNITVGNNWRLTAPSATTNDSKGTVLLSEALPLTLCYRVYGADSYLQAQLLTDEQNGRTNSSAQTIIYANALANPIVKVPVLIPFDETGVQYPSQISQYNLLPTS